MKIIKIQDALKQVEQPHPEKENKAVKVPVHYGYWVTVQTYQGASDRS